MSNMVVRTNVFALNAHRNMKNVGVDQNRASNRLSSGFRINSAADDAAGLAISESMRAQIRGLDQASRNTQDGQALIQTAEGGMQEIQNMLQRIRELTVQGSNDTNILENRADHIRLEIEQLIEEIDDMAARVEFNGMTLLDGSLGAQLSAFTGVTGAAVNGSGINDALSLAMGSALAHFAADALVASPPVAAFGGVNAAAIDGIWLFMTGDTSVAAGADRQAALNDLLGLGGTAVASLAAAGNLTGAAAADALATLRAINSAVRGGLDFQVGANSGQMTRAQISDMRMHSDEGRTIANARGLGGAMGGFLGQWETALRSDQGSNITELINQVNAGIEFVSVSRAELGAISNRLDFTSRSLDISSENLSDAESRVRNTDMAREMMNFTMANVLQQASVSMLSQANQLPNNLLQLLR